MPAEIEAAKLAIQAEWSAAEEQRRRNVQHVDWSVPRCGSEVGEPEDE